MYMEYGEIAKALQEADEKVNEGKRNGTPLGKDAVLAVILKPLIIFPDTQSMTPDEMFHEGFRQAKILISPMTPPNYELEKAVDIILQEMGIRRSRKSAEARAPHKKPNTMGRKRAAEEELSSAPSERRKKKSIQKDPNMNKGHRVGKGPISYCMVCTRNNCCVEHGYW